MRPFRLFLTICYIIEGLHRRGASKVSTHLKSGFLKTPTGIFLWLVASHNFQPPERKCQKSYIWWLSGWVARWLGGWWLGGWWLGGQGLKSGWLVVGGWWLQSPDPHIHTHTDHKHRKKRTHLFSRRAMGYKVFGKNGELLPKFSKTPGGASCLFLSTLILLHIMATQNCDPPPTMVFLTKRYHNLDFFQKKKLYQVFCQK